MGRGRGGGGPPAARLVDFQAAVRILKELNPK
jgi:hypothetical protein